MRFICSFFFGYSDDNLQPCDDCLKIFVLLSLQAFPISAAILPCPPHHLESF